MSPQPLLSITDSGLFCEAGNFYIDPWAPVARAIITHAHSDHARFGAGAYLAAPGNEFLLRTRLGADAPVEVLSFGERVNAGDVILSFHPAGHILGSAQVRVEHRKTGEVWVVSGDYKIEPDPTCPPFEPVKCHTFITEATFGLPIYRWENSDAIFDQINNWWRNNQSRDKASILYCYALGKAQRILAGVDASIGPIYTHGAVESLTQDYRAAGVNLPDTKIAAMAPRKTKWSEALVLAPPLAHGTPWLRRFGSIATGFASGWMAVRGMRRRKAIDRGFVLSDHSDWDGLLSAVGESQAQRVLVTHGYATEMVKYLQELGIESGALSTRFEGELNEQGTEIENAEAVEES